MRLSNRNKAAVYSFMNSALLMIFAGGIIGFLIERYRFNILGWESYLLIIIPLLLLVIFYFAGRQIFEYDSDGEALNFKNRNVLSILNRPVNDEFPKYKVQKFEVVNLLIFKRLYVTISSKKSHSTTLQYDITFLTSKEISDLKHSLNKIVTANKKNDKDI